MAKYPLYRKDNRIPVYHKITSAHEILTVHNMVDYYGIFFFTQEPQKVADIMENYIEVSCAEFSKNLNQVIGRAAQEKSCPDAVNPKS